MRGFPAGAPIVLKSWRAAAVSCVPLISASRHVKQTILMITHNNNLTSSVDRVFRVSDGILTDLGGTANEALS